MFEVVVISDDHALSHHLERIVLSINKTGVSKISFDAPKLDALSNVHPNSIVIIDISSISDSGLFQKLQESIAGLSSITVSTINHEDAAYMAKELKANALFVGEINEMEVKFAIERLINHPIKHTWKIVDGKKILFIDRNEIEWIKTKGNYSSIWHSGKETIIRKALKQIEEEILSDNIIKIHRSTLINRKYISEISMPSNKIMMESGDTFSIGRSYRKSITENISHYS